VGFAFAVEPRLASGRIVRIDTAADVRDRVLKDLPAGIHLQAAELRIEFRGAEDLLRHLYELSQTIVNDYERFQVVVENATCARKLPVTLQNDCVAVEVR
jgi:hypothetical protein